MLGERIKAAIAGGTTWSALADAAGVSRTTLWRLAGRQSARDREAGQRTTVDAVEHVRAALNRLAPGETEIPPPVVPVRSADHYRALLAVDERRRRK
jgi:hypothetical protein